MANEGRVIDVTNITEKDFTHPYGGTPFTIKAGQTITYPFYIGAHLAKHLARRILVEGDKSATTYDPKNPDPAGGNGVPLATEQTEQAWMDKIMTGDAMQAVAVPLSEVELLKKQIADLNAFRQSIEGKVENKPVEEAKVEPAESEPNTDIESAPNVPVFSDKADVIAELKKREIEFDARKSKDSLEALLK